MRPVLAAAVGAATAIGTDVLTRRIARDRRVEFAALGLVGAAVIYPAGRRGHFGDGLERGTLAAATALAVTALALPTRTGRRLVAAGWLAHAGFDAAFRGRDSRIPSWYPPMCAGYDAAVAACLITG